MKRVIFAIAAMALIASGSLASFATVQGADHKDGPALGNDTSADGTDLYVFKSPENPANVVFVVDANPFIAPGETRGYDPTITYKIKIDRTGDSVADANILVLPRQTAVEIQILGDNNIVVPITAAGAPPQIVVNGGVKALRRPG